MCGIWGLVNYKKKNLDMTKLFQDFWSLKHRGPDNSFFETYSDVFIGFHRLAIMDDTFSANQPFIFEDETRTVIFICNGEIYNYKEIIQQRGLIPNNKSDCAVIPLVYMGAKGHYDFNTFIREEVKGEFAFALFEFDRLKNLKKVIVGRDNIGVRPLYYSPEGGEVLLFSSEIKGGLESGVELQEFPPGGIFTYHFDELGACCVDKDTEVDVYNTWEEKWSDKRHLAAVRGAVMNSVRRRLCADKPIAFLLSGGVDSSLVASLGAKILGKPIRTFCCGMEGGTDLAFARMVAKHIGSNHTEVIFTPEEALAAIPDVIRTIESWDVTTIRASVGQYLVSKWIGTQTDCKVVLVGEGSDEICSSYLFNWYAPNGDALDKCSREYVKNIHYYDVKRADRCISRWGLEGRVPLLDTEFMKAYWAIPGDKRMPTYKGMEKWWLRQAFAGTGLLPDEVLWRTKEAFSDAVSNKTKSWFQIIQEWVDGLVSDAELAGASEKYPNYTPQTKEAFYYRKVFCSIFGENRQTAIPGYWLPKWSSDGKEVSQFVDPSARTLDIYTKLDENS
jgi:asparagine synthase (glutamine-hydrolysing)